jgi:hypothetical protein
MQSMRKILFPFQKIQILIVIFVFLQVIGRDIIIYASFKINQDFIAKVLCINKEKPELGCNGKCQLSKDLKKNNSEDKENKTNIPSTKNEQKINLYSKTCSRNGQFFNQARQQYYNIEILHSYLMISEIFHPPRILFI